MTDANTPETPEPIDTPITPPQRHVSIRVDFETEGEERDVTYGSKLEQPYNVDPQQYAKLVAEYVERTVLLHLGALPVLQKIEVTA